MKFDFMTFSAVKLRWRESTSRGFASTKNLFISVNGKKGGRKLPDDYHQEWKASDDAMRNGVDENPFNLLAQNPSLMMMSVENFMCIRLTLQEHSCGSFFVIEMAETQLEND